MKVRKLLSGSVLALALGSILLYAQGGGTPSTLRVITDATNALMLSGTTQTLPLSQPTIFNNTRLRTDASGNLVVVISGGAAPTDATYITQTPNSGLSAEQALSTLSTGILGVTTTTGVVSSIANVAAGQVLTSGTPAAYSATPTITNITASTPGIITTSTDGFLCQNSTAATAGVPVQQSCRFRLRSNVWNTTATAANNTDDWWIESVPVSGTTPSGLLKFGKSLNGGATTFPMTVTSGGVLTTLGVISSGGNLLSASRIGWSNGTGWSSASDGLVNLQTNGAGAGIGLDFATDAILKIRTRAQTGDASLTALALGGAGTGTSVANVGANSCGTTAATIAGNQVSGVITVGATAGTQCRVTFTTAAPVARDCIVTDSTTTIATRATVVSTTAHDFLGAFVAGDLITYVCMVR